MPGNSPSQFQQLQRYRTALNEIVTKLIENSETLKKNKRPSNKNSQKSLIDDAVNKSRHILRLLERIDSYPKMIEGMNVKDIRKINAIINPLLRDAREAHRTGNELLQRFSEV